MAQSSLLERKFVHRMKVFLALFVVSIALGSCVQAGKPPKWRDLMNMDYTFEQYTEDFHKSYEPDEYNARKQLFEQNLATIIRHNKDPRQTWKMGVNQFTSMTEEEKKKMAGYRRAIGYKRNGDGVTFNEKSSNEAQPGWPDWIDWRDSGIITAVKDQGQCGSCWSFGTSETIESYWALKYGQLPVLSEQFILDCTNNSNDCGGNGGCGGGTPEIAYDMIIQRGGIPSEWTTPYLSYFGRNFPCPKFPPKLIPAAKLKSYVKLSVNNYTSVMDAIAKVGPQAINVDASSWHSYEEGVFNGCNMTSPVIDHVVQLVGYGSDNGVDYWLIRNSWSPTWGESGYIKLQRYGNNEPCGWDTNPADGTGCNGGPSKVYVCGMCGILYDVSYPIVD